MSGAFHLTLQHFLGNFCLTHLSWQPSKKRTCDKPKVIYILSLVTLGTAKMLATPLTVEQLF